MYDTLAARALGVFPKTMACLLVEWYQVHLVLEYFADKKREEAAS